MSRFSTLLLGRELPIVRRFYPSNIFITSLISISPYEWFKWAMCWVTRSGSWLMVVRIRITFLASLLYHHLPYTQSRVALHLFFADTKFAESTLLTTAGIERNPALQWRVHHY